MRAPGIHRLHRWLAASSTACALALAGAVPAFADAPNDPGFGVQWALSGAGASVHAPQAWCANLGGVLVADVDTGADFNHADLAGKLVAGARFTSGRGDESHPDATGQAAVQDDQGHGTMTTGIIVAGTNNGTGITGVAPAAKALVVKVLVPDASDSSKATGYPVDAAAGIRYAADYPGVRVINLSLGSDIARLLGVPLQSNPLLPAIEYAWSRNVLVVAASGNSQDSQTNYNSVKPHALVVGALARDGSAAGYSSPGSNVDAPGGDARGGTPTTETSVLSTYLGNAYAVGDGTSFAAPMVAGTAAMLAARGLGAADIRGQVIATEVAGSHLDAAAALGRADNGPACPPTASGSAPPAGGGISIKPVPSRRPAGSAAPRPAAAAAPPVALASPSPSPSPSPSASPTPLEDSMPSPRSLAHPPPRPPASGPPAGLLAVGVGLLGAAGLGVWRLLPLMR
jgi:hypothetical protein